MPLKPANEIVTEPLSWLWPDRIPLGKLVILDGDPDLGKSLIGLDLCARLSTARPFPDGQPGLGPASALVLSAEDAAGDTIAPRLRELGADMGRIYVFDRDTDDDEWPWRFPAHAGRLDEAIGQTDARLAVIDPVTAFLDDSVLCASDQSVRRALAPLIQLAQKRRCTLLLLRHLNKQGGGQALYRGLGSIAFVAACRFAMLVARDPAVAGRCVLANVRSSLAVAQSSLTYRIRAGPGGLPTIDWLGESARSADELLARPGRADDGPRERAVAFLLEYLAAGPRPAQEVRTAAEKGGHAARTLERAHKELEITSRRVVQNGRQVSYWLLPDQEL